MRGVVACDRWSGLRGYRFGANWRAKRISGWLPAPLKIISDALRLADVGTDDVVYDLGCGDGRVITRAAKLFGAEAVGVDIDPRRVRQSRWRIQKCCVSHLAEVRRQDLVEVPDLARATVVYLYLPQHAVNRLVSILWNRCRRGTRIVSVSSWLYGWRTEKELTVRLNGIKWYIGLWIV